jgi:general secretion pathway protein K
MVRVLKRRERGIALLAVLMAIALMTLIVVDFTTTAALGYLSAANQANELRAYYLARSAVAVGLGLLAEDSRTDSVSQTPYDGLADVWAMPFPPVDVDGGKVTVSITDEARKLDINKLINPATGQVDPKQVAIFTRLFTILNLSPQLLPAVIDWIDPDSNETPSGAELDYYMRLIPPYAPRNGPMPTIGDLKLVRGVDATTFNVLRPFVTVAPELQVNIDTARPEVIAALAPELMNNPQLVQEIVLARTIRPFTKVTDVGNLPGVGPFFTRLSQVLTVRSVYFTIAGMGTFAGSRKLVYSVFNRQHNGTGTLVSWQED